MVNVSGLNALPPDHGFDHDNRDQEAKKGVYAHGQRSECGEIAVGGFCRATSTLGRVRVARGNREENEGGLRTGARRRPLIGHLALLPGLVSASRHQLVYGLVAGQ